MRGRFHGQRHTRAARLAQAAMFVVLGVLALGLAQRRPDAPPRAALDLASGHLSMVNSKDGAAILSAANMAPGGAATGSVTIRNAGDVAGDFKLSKSQLTSTPGPGGGALPGRLSLQVRDVTSPASPVVVYDGPLAAMGDIALGSYAANQTRA